MDLISRILAPGLFGAQMVDADQPAFLAPQEEALVAQAAFLSKAIRPVVPPESRWHDVVHAVAAELGLLTGERS